MTSNNMQLEIKFEKSKKLKKTWEKRNALSLRLKESTG